MNSSFKFLKAEIKFEPITGETVRGLKEEKAEQKT